eukprot:scaffold25090_cov57-Phaeocystis_antarctica.AAC.6
MHPQAAAAPPQLHARALGGSCSVGRFGGQQLEQQRVVLDRLTPLRRLLANAGTRGEQRAPLVLRCGGGQTHRLVEVEQGARRASELPELAEQGRAAQAVAPVAEGSEVVSEDLVAARPLGEEIGTAAHLERRTVAEDCRWVVAARSCRIACSCLLADDPLGCCTRRAGHLALPRSGTCTLRPMSSVCFILAERVSRNFSTRPNG